MCQRMGQYSDACKFVATISKNTLIRFIGTVYTPLAVCQQLGAC